MRSVLTDEAPVPEIRGGLVYLIFPDNTHPPVATPRHVFRKFCEMGIRMLDEDDRKPSNVRQMRKRPGHG